MSKKTLNIEAITNELRGNSAFFPNSFTTPPQENQELEPKKDYVREEITTQENTTPQNVVINPVTRVNNKARKEEDSIVINITSNITILQSEIDRLKEPSYKPQTFRLGDEEIDKLKDLAYELSKRTKRKVTQGDLLRIALLLLEKNMVSNKDDLLKILKEL